MGGAADGAVRLLWCAAKGPLLRNRPWSIRPPPPPLLNGTWYLGPLVCGQGLAKVVFSLHMEAIGGGYPCRGKLASAIWFLWYKPPNPNRFLGKHKPVNGGHHKWVLVLRDLFTAMLQAAGHQVHGSYWPLGLALCPVQLTRGRPSAARVESIRVTGWLCSTWGVGEGVLWGVDTGQLTGSGCPMVLQNRGPQVLLSRTAGLGPPTASPSP